MKIEQSKETQMSKCFIWCHRPPSDEHCASNKSPSDLERWNPTGGCITLNFAAIIHLYPLMRERGMLALDGPPPEPDPASFGITDAPSPLEIGGDTSPELLAYRRAYFAWLGARISAPGMPLSKLSTNDLWHVTPDEINEALANGERLPAPDSPLWSDFIAFLRGAVLHGGFFVY
jgi:hypothetical protein